MQRALDQAAAANAPQVVQAGPPNPFPAPPGPATPGVRPRDILEWQRLRQSFAHTPGKNYGGTRGDSAFINWTLAILQTTASAVVTGFSYEFLTAYSRYRGASSQNFKHAYYSCQFVLGLSILTFALLAMYVLWVFADSELGRHTFESRSLTHIMLMLPQVDILCGRRGYILLRSMAL